MFQKMGLEIFQNFHTSLAVRGLTTTSHWVICLLHCVGLRVSCLRPFLSHGIYASVNQVHGVCKLQLLALLLSNRSGLVTGSKTSRSGWTLIGQKFRPCSISEISNQHFTIIATATL